MRDLCAAGHLKIMKLNLPEFQAGLQASWEWCRQANCFSGSHGSSPVPEEKLLPYLFLLSHLGFLSGRWSRPVQHTMVGQRGGNVMWVAGPAPPVAAPAPPVAAPAMAMPGPPAQVVAGPSLLEQAQSIIANAPPPGPVMAPFEAVEPNRVCHVAYADLSQEEKVLANICWETERCDANPLQRRAVETVGFYISLVGASKVHGAPVKKLSPGYSSKAAMARAIMLWAGPQWVHRVEWQLPA